MVKRLFAVGTGVAMLGATAMGAAAASLDNYPDMFVTDGTFNGWLVVGENAASVDNLAMTDIAASMKYKGSGKSTTTTVTGDSWMVGTSSKKLEFANNNATASGLTSEDFRDITTFADENDLDALADGVWATNENEYDYQQFLFFDTEGEDSLDQSRIVKYTENDDDETADHLFIKSGRQIARYKLEFSSTAQSDVTDSAGTADTTGTYLDDFENTDLSFLGNDYSVVLARRTSAAPTDYEAGIKLTLMSGSSRDTLLEGETKTYTVGDKTYEVTLTFVDDDEAKFTVNGESTNKLKVGETYVLSDKSEVGVSEVLYQSYAGGVHSSTFFVGASKMVLQDDNVEAIGTGEKKLKVGSEDIDGTSVFITGTDDNTTFTVSTIEVNMTADDDFFVGADQKLSDVVLSTGEEKEVLMNGAFDIEYKGLTEEESHELKLRSSSSRRYKLHLFDGDGNAVDIPVAYAESATNITFGEDSAVNVARTNAKRLIIDEYHTIYKDDYFIITGGTASDGSAKSYLLQYKGSDKSTDTSPKIKFKNMGNAETLEYSASTVGFNGVIATIKLGGYSFDAVAVGSDQSADDYRIRVALDTTAPSSTTNATTGQNPITFVDSYGSQWFFNVTCNQNDQGNPVTSNACLNETADNISGLYKSVTAVQLTMDTPNGDDYDNQVPMRLGINISAAAGPEVRAGFLTTATQPIVSAALNPSAVTLITPDGETEVSYGYTSMGVKITLNEPASDPDEIILDYPAKQRIPQVYFTSGATTSSKTSSGDLTRVTVVDATKLDSEVADAKGQNLIVVGGPCVNSVAADLMDKPSDCTEGFTPGKARVRLFEHANGNMAMLVAGYSGKDTRLAGKVLAHRWDELSGTDASVEGTTYSDAKIGVYTAAKMEDKSADKAADDAANTSE